MKEIWRRGEPIKSTPGIAKVKEGQYAFFSDESTLEGLWQCGLIWAKDKFQTYSTGFPVQKHFKYLDIFNDRFGKVTDNVKLYI